jgi:hypothetical protein
MMRNGVTGKQAAGFIAFLVAAAAVAGGVGGFRWLEFVAIAGTAFGTLGLAFYTHDLARATQRQIDVGNKEVTAAEKAATEAARARIDALAPLVALTVRLDSFIAPKRPEFGTPWLTDDAQLDESELDGFYLEVTLAFELTNYGRSPAYVSFPSLRP